MVKIKDQVAPGSELLQHRYSLGANVGSMFAIGNVGAKDDFWLAGMVVKETQSYGYLSGNLLDFEGNVLVRIVDSEV
jgi:hypothetical protein